MQTCFMCSMPATTDDHIPPKCIFPEYKDTGVDYRQNLITVPACAEHNWGTSLNDEYLLGILALHWRNNQAAYAQSMTKLKRAFKHSRKLYDLFLGPAQNKLIYWDGQTLITAPVDMSRFTSSMDKISRGIYYNHFDKKWMANVDIWPISLVPIYDTDPYPIVRLLEEVRAQIRALCMGQSQNGSNPDIFYYQILQRSPAASSYIRLVFYGGFEVIAALRKSVISCSLT
jgi:hypothetical protein